MTTSKPAGRTELQHWHPFSEAFPWIPRLGQLFENIPCGIGPGWT